jgi:hypothetical protein
MTPHTDTTLPRARVLVLVMRRIDEFLGISVPARLRIHDVATFAVLVFLVFCVAKFVTEPLSRTIAFAPFVVVGTFASYLAGFLLGAGDVRQVVLYAGLGSRPLQLSLRLLALALSQAIVLALAFSAFAVLDPRMKEGVPPFVFALFLIVSINISVGIARWVGRLISKALPRGGPLLMLATVADAIRPYGVLASYLVATAWVAFLVTDTAIADRVVVFLSPVSSLTVGAAFFSGLGFATVQDESVKRAG